MIRPYYELIRDIDIIKEIKRLIDIKSPPLINFKPMQGIVKEKGVDNILLNESTANHVVEKYGKAFDLYDVNGASIEMKYFMLDFSCFFHQDDIDMKIFAVRLWKKHKAFQKHCKEVNINIYDASDFTLQDVFEYYCDDAEYIKWCDDMYYVEFGFYRYYFFPPEYDGQDESYLKIESIMIVQSKSVYNQRQSKANDINVTVLTFIELKMSDYIEMYGQDESVKIMEKLNDSKLFLDNLKVAVTKRHVANANTISNIIHSSHYKFLLAPKRKIYFGSLFFLKSLYINFGNFGVPVDEYEFTRTLLEICKPFED